MKYLLILLAAAVIFPSSNAITSTPSNQAIHTPPLIGPKKKDPSPSPIPSVSASATPDPTSAETPKQTILPTAFPAPILSPIPIFTPPPEVHSFSPEPTLLPKASSNPEKENTQNNLPAVLGAQTTPPQTPPPAAGKATDPIIPFIQNLLSGKEKSPNNSNQITPPQLLRYGTSPADFYLNQRLTSRENLVLLILGTASLGVGLYLYRPLLILKLKSKFWPFSFLAPVTVH